MISPFALGENHNHCFEGFRSFPAGASLAPVVNPPSRAPHLCATCQQKLRFIFDFRDEWGGRRPQAA